MLNHIVGDGRIPSIPTSVHATCTPSPQVGINSLLSISFSADPIWYTYAQAQANGGNIGDQIFAPGSTGGGVTNIVAAPGTAGFVYTIKVVRTNSASLTGWPRSSVIEAPESFIVAP